MLLLTDETRALIRQHEGTDPAEIALLASRFPDRPYAFVAQQVKGRLKAARKLPSWRRHPDVVYGTGLSLEQCSSEIVSRYRADLVGRFASGIDLTGGFGVDSRFLGEKADCWTYCERDPELARVAENNFEAFGLGDRVRVVAGDGVATLFSGDHGYDVAFVDPARRDARMLKVSAFEDCEPDLLGIWDRLRSLATTVLVKASPGLDISAAVSQLSGVRAAHVIAVGNECKELMFVAGEGAFQDPEVVCVSLSDSGGAIPFRFRISEEASLPGAFGPPARFLYEPNAAIMKGGAFKSLAERFGLVALHPRTRLYTNGEALDAFPGRAFEIVGQGPLNAKTAKRLFPDGRANVISRNSGMKADELRRKLQLNDGGELFAIGASVVRAGRALFACRLASKTA